MTGSPNLQGDIALGSGLTPDQIIWNFSGGNSASLNNNQSSFPNLAAGIILDPLGAMSLVNANLTGRVFGGDSHNMQIISGDNINQPGSATPEPSSIS